MMLNKSEIPSFSYLLQPHRCGCTFMCTCDTCGTCTRIHCVLVCNFTFSFWQTFGVHIGPGNWGFFSKKILSFCFFYCLFLLFAFFLFLGMEGTHFLKKPCDGDLVLTLCAIVPFWCHCVMQLFLLTVQVCVIVFSFIC